MTLKNDFKIAVDALRVAFKSALDDPDFDDNTLAETWRHFLGMQAIWKKLPEANDCMPPWGHSDLEYGLSSTVFPDGSTQYDFNTIAAGPVNIDGAFGKDVITFS